MVGLGVLWGKGRGRGGLVPEYLGILITNIEKEVEVPSWGILKRKEKMSGLGI